MNKKIIVILILILLVQTVFFAVVTSSKDDFKSIEKESNEFYEEYKASPEKFTVVDAAVKGRFTSVKFMNSADDVPYITVEFALPDGSLMQTQVLEDYKKNNEGDTIQIAYRFGNDDAKTSTIRATQLYYVENNRAYDRILMLQIGDVCLAVIITMLMLKKAKE